MDDKERAQSILDQWFGVPPRNTKPLCLRVELRDIIEAAFAEARREERERVIQCFHERLYWDGEGYVWAPSREDYREDPRYVVLRALDGDSDGDTEIGCKRGTCDWWQYAECTDPVCQSLRDDLRGEGGRLMRFARLRHLAGWHLNRWWLRVVFRFYGCRGEGYYLDKNGEAQPCNRRGCH